MTTYRMDAPEALTGFGDATTVRGSTLEQLVAFAAVFLVTLQKISVGPDIMPRHLVAAALLPVWLMAVGRWRGALAWVLLGAGSGVAGLILTGISSRTHDVSTNSTIKELVLLIGLVAGVCVVLWSRQILTDRQVALAFAGGVVLNGTAGLESLSGSGVLKFGLLLPITVVLLALTNRLGLGVQLLAVVALIVLSSFSDARSTFGMMVIVAAVLFWQLRPTKVSRAKSWVSTAALFAVLGVVVYRLGTALLVAGFLGAEAQRRSITQLAAAGSLIVGGRPEMAAAAALFYVHPFGFGPGVSVTHGELMVAKAGMAAINYSPENGYVERYMFGSDIIELHSVTGDLWATFGLVGLALALFISWQVIRNLSVMVMNRQANALVLFLGCFTLWNMFFSPLYSSTPTLIVTLALILPMGAGRRSRPNGSYAGDVVSTRF